MIGAGVVVAVILAFWTSGAAIYRWTWGRWLRISKWPFALGFCLMGKRADRWEVGYVRPFLVGQLYDKDSKPGPYPNHDLPLADLRRLVTASRGDRRPDEKRPRNSAQPRPDGAGSTSSLSVAPTDTASAAKGQVQP